MLYICSVACNHVDIVVLRQKRDVRNVREGSRYVVDQLPRFTGSHGHRRYEQHVCLITITIDVVLLINLYK